MLQVAVCTAAGDQTDPDIDGDRVVWTDDRSGAWDIYGCYLTTMATFSICTAEAERYEPAVSGNVVVQSGNGCVEATLPGELGLGATAAVTARRPRGTAGS